MKPAKIRGNYTPRPTQNQKSDQKTKQLVFLAALLFLIAAIISIYVAWNDLRGLGTTEVIV